MQYKYIELKGITPEAIALLAKAEYQLTEFDAALNSLTTALMMIEDDAELYEFRASIYMDRDQQYLACQDWEAAVKLGSSKALISAKTNCGYRETLPPSPPVSDVKKEDDQDGMYVKDTNEADLTEVKESDEIMSDPEIKIVLTTEDPESNIGNQDAPVIQTSSIDSISSSEDLKMTFSFSRICSVSSYLSCL